MRGVGNRNGRGGELEFTVFGKCVFVSKRES